MTPIKRLLVVVLFIATISAPLIVAILGIMVYVTGLKLLPGRLFQKGEAFFNTALGFGLFGSLLAWIIFLKNNWPVAVALVIGLVVVVAYYEIRPFFNNLKIRA